MEASAPVDIREVRRRLVCMALPGLQRASEDPGLFDLLSGLSAQQLIDVLSDDIAQFGGAESFGIAQQLVQPILQRKLILEQLEGQKLMAQAAEDLQRASVELGRKSVELGHQSIILQVATGVVAVAALVIGVLALNR